MEIKIKVEDLKTLIDGLNNAIIAYNEIVNSIELYCDIPSKMLPLKKVPLENLRKRQEALKTVYEQLIEIEKDRI